jgi:hypothetical protein
MREAQCVVYPEHQQRKIILSSAHVVAIATPRIPCNHMCHAMQADIIVQVPRLTSPFQAEA